MRNLMKFTPILILFYVGELKGQDIAANNAIICLDGEIVKKIIPLS